MTRATIKAAQRHAQIRVEGIDIAWHTMTGGGRTAITSDDPDTETGGIIVGEVRAENIVLSTSFSPRQDLEWMRRLKTGIGDLTLTVTRQWTDENWSPIGDPEIYPDCILIGYENPTSAPTGDDVEFTITLHTPGEAL